MPISFPLVRRHAGSTEDSRRLDGPTRVFWRTEWLLDIGWGAGVKDLELLTIFDRDGTTALAAR